MCIAIIYNVHVQLHFMQVGDKLQEVYEVFMSLSEKVLEAQKKVTQAIKAHHQNCMEAKSPPDEPTGMCVEGRRMLFSDSKSTSSIVFYLFPPPPPPLHHLEDSANSKEDLIQAATKELEVAQEEHEETTAKLKSLLDCAMNLGLKSKVEQIEGKIAEVARELLAGAAATVEEKVPEEYQQETQRSREELQR